MNQSGNVISIRSVFSWGFLNIALLGIGAAGLPLWSHHPVPRESLAIYVLICGQILLTSMLFPLLAETPWSLAINLAILLPIDELGGLLSNLDQLSILKCAAYVGLWTAGLGAWRSLLKSEQAILGIVTAATCFTAGGAVLDYLRWENASSSNQSEAFAPGSLLAGICDLVLHFNPLSWFQVSLPMLLAVIWLTVVRFSKLRSISLHNAS